MRLESRLCEISLTPTVKGINSPLKNVLFYTTMELLLQIEFDMKIFSYVGDKTSS